MAVIDHAKFNPTDATIVTRVNLSIPGTLWPTTAQNKKHKNEHRNIQAFILFHWYWYQFSLQNITTESGESMSTSSPMLKLVKFLPSPSFP